jgi:hypothetical protein
LQRTSAEDDVIIIRSETYVPGVRARQITDFLLHCDDRKYQRWWPGTHLHFHTRARRRGSDIVYMDELIGKRRVKLKGELAEFVPGRRIVWQLKLLVRQPVRLILELEEDGGGVCVTHTIRAGFQGIGKLFDPLFRLWFTQEFTRAMHDHVKSEFPMLGRVLQAE